MKKQRVLSAFSVSIGLISAVATSAATATLGVTVNNSTVTLTRGVVTVIGGPGSGAPVLIDIGSLVVPPEGAPAVSGSFRINGQFLPLTVRVLSRSADGKLRYEIDGGRDVSVGTSGRVTAQPFGGSVSPGIGPVRVPITATLTWHPAAP